MSVNQSTAVREKNIISELNFEQKVYQKMEHDPFAGQEF